MAEAKSFFTDSKPRPARPRMARVVDSGILRWLNSLLRVATSLINRTTRSNFSPPEIGTTCQDGAAHPD